MILAHVEVEENTNIVMVKYNASDLLCVNAIRFFIYF